ncbi:hypothetical protein [Streptomyces sp. Ac-502]|uniref:hypothetical protein n=1 Tax=Streptomyces sp. Ac-502 TaxID=3342801 RepID=UPI003862C21A
MPWPTARRLLLPPWAQDRKQAAIHHFTSQITPFSLATDAVTHAGTDTDADTNADTDAGPAPDTVILPPTELAHHTRPFETVFV